MKNILQLFFIAILALTTTFNSLAQGTTYYSQGSLEASNKSKWSSVADGTGGSNTKPANFAKGDYFIIQAGHAMTAASNWTISGTGATLTIESTASLSISSGITISITTSLTNNGTLNNGGVITATLVATATGNTVNYTGAAQSVIATDYSNLGLSGSGEKTISTGTSITDNLSISGTCTASIGTGLNISVGSLTLGGAAQSAGIWGSTSSTAAITNDTYFAATNGILTIDVSAPIATSATIITSSSFDANWGSVSGATGYILDVATDAAFTNIINVLENFSGFNKSSGSNDLSATLDTYMQKTGWTSTTGGVFEELGFAKFGTDAAGGEIISPTLDLSENSGNHTLTFSVAKCSNFATNIQVLYAADGISYTQLDLFAGNVGFDPKSYSITGGTANSKIKIVSSSYGFFIDDLNITNYSNIITTTSQKISELADGTTYYYRVRAFAPGVISSNSNTITQATIAAAFTPAVSVSTVGLDISWIGGDGDGVIVVINNVNSFTAPTDGQTFTANTVYTSGEQVVYDGDHTSSTVTVSGILEADLWVAVFEYKNLSDGGAKATVRVYQTGVLGGPGGFTGVLPIELLSFDAEQENNDVILKWATATEINNAFFTVEKSYDGINFFELAKVKGSGNSNVINDYQIIDNTDIATINYYRLMQTDFDGNYTYSKIISLSDKSNDSFKILNSWVGESGTINMEIQSSTLALVQIELVNSLGQVVYNNTVSVNEGKGLYIINTSNYTEGLYFIRCKTKGDVAVRKIKL